MATRWLDFAEKKHKILLFRWRIIALVILLFKTPSFYALSNAALIPSGSNGNPNELTFENPLPLPPLEFNDSSTAPWVAISPDDERNEDYSRLSLRLANYDLPPLILKKAIKYKLKVMKGQASLDDLKTSFTTKELLAYGDQLIDITVSREPGTSIVAKSKLWYGARSNQRSPRNADSSKSFGYYCDIGSIQPSPNLDAHERKGKHLMVANWIHIYMLRTQGWSLDVWLLHEFLGVKYVLFDDNVYLLTCPKVDVTFVHSETCYSDNAKEILVNNQTKYLTRNRFVTEHHSVIECPKSEKNNQILKLTDFYIALTSSSALLANVLFLNKRSPTIMSRIMNDENAENLLWLEEKYLSCSSSPVLITLFIWIRRLSPYLLAGFSLFKLISMLILFCMAMHKKLPCIHIWSILCVPIKRGQDYMKWAKEAEHLRQLHDLNTGRIATGLESSSSTSLDPSEHLIALYLTCCDLKERLAALELELRSRDSSQTSRDLTPELPLIIQDPTFLTTKRSTLL